MVPNVVHMSPRFWHEGNPSEFLHYPLYFLSFGQLGNLLIFMSLVELEDLMACWLIM
jgi:hypothetical protein